MELETQEAPDSLARFREIVKVDKSHKPSMSEAAAQKLRAIGEAEKSTKAANRIFAEQFALLPKDTWTIVQVLKQVYSADQKAYTPLMTDRILERMVNKIRMYLRQGCTITEPHDLTFLGTLTAEEMSMSDEHFVNMISAGFDKPRDDAFRGRCANLTCGKGRDAKGNRVRARVPEIGGLCSPECKKVVKEAQKQSRRGLVTI